MEGRPVTLRNDKQVREIREAFMKWSDSSSECRWGPPIDHFGREDEYGTG